MLSKEGLQIKRLANLKEPQAADQRVLMPRVSNLGPNPWQLPKGTRRGSGEGSLTFGCTTVCRAHHVIAETSSPRQGGFFWGLSMKWMLLLVLVVIGVGTLMGTTATPVL